ncbi:hypothetical Protein YC6258_03547 [Gynuella sunshinyii YC6258]|uniref:Uncharacterized protein n=1 Tax=Gynuella sunshinyii YC6258 TaxID=1445510 RepID=A0A0C5VQ75_9GAMM|nr:hypothetical Protein YC6258_03547 [Gynuella sunshinyii YC6258]
METQLGELATTTALIASRMPDLDKLAGSLVPGIKLSDQALNILRQMAENKAEYFLVHGSMAGTSLIPSNGKSIEYEDDQFLQDDLATLVELQLLRLGYNSSGKEMYHFTRTGAKLVQLADGKSAL